MPSTQSEWQNIAAKYEEMWNFPNCIGAIDGKHIILQAPINSNHYNPQFNIVLMAAADADYNFTFVDIDCQERILNRDVFKNCELHKRIEKDQLNLPEPSVLPGTEIKAPYVFVGDTAFPLCDNIMKPYSGIYSKGSKRIFNYRLSRAHCVIENVFGIVSSVFRVLQKPLFLAPEKGKIIVMTIVCLHNFLRQSKTSRKIYTPPGSLDTDVNGKIVFGRWRDEQKNMSKKTSFLNLRAVSRKTKCTAQYIRKEFTEYFCTKGEIPWQNQYA